jgi:site-specific DNA-methyltransferase (adenine-specific)
MKPYFEKNGIAIYHGDSREIIPALDRWFDVMLTDPVWPNAAPELIGSEDPLGLLTDVCALMLGRVRRLVLHLGQTSDPRILLAVPSEFRFFRMCVLEYHRPIRMGRVLYGGDVAYIFGAVPRWKPGGVVLSGKTSCKYIGRVDAHPCPRQLEHVLWLAKHYAEGTILDPFMGRGTTLSAAAITGLPAVGIEIEERYCEIAAIRLESEIQLGPSAQHSPLAATPSNT